MPLLLELLGRRGGSLRREHAPQPFDVHRLDVNSRLCAILRFERERQVTDDLHATSKNPGAALPMMLTEAYSGRPVRSSTNT